MKKFKITLTCLMLATMASAQLAIKPHVGFNVSRLTTDPEFFDSDAARIGALIGLSGKIGDRFFFEPGIQYFSMTQDRVHSTDQDLSFDATLRGLRVPLMVGFHLNERETFLNARIFAGPSGTFILGVNQSKTNQDAPQKDDYSKTIFGGVVGLGLDLWIFHLDMGYEWGLSPFYNNNSGFGDGRNNMFIVTLGFNIGKL